MTVSLGTSNRCIEVSLEDYLRMSDDDFRDMIAQEQGFIINNPYTGSILADLTKGKIEVPEEEEDEFEDNSLFNPEDIADFLESDSYGEI